MISPYKIKKTIIGITTKNDVIKNLYKRGDLKRVLVWKGFLNQVVFECLKFIYCPFFNKWLVINM
ncbi:hypothetical protein DTQ32_02320, partial [Ureaplasma parvum]